MMTKRKIGITFVGLNAAYLDKIQAVAPNFDIIVAEKDDAALTDCEVIFGNPSKSVLANADNLKWLHTETAGVDAYAHRDSGLADGVILTNSVGAYGIGISEHLLTLTLMLLRKMDEYGKVQAQAKWQDLGRVRALYGSLVTVVGIGDIGGNFAARCKALGAMVYGVSRTARNEVPLWADKLFSVDKLDEAVQNADVVALCLPGTADTVGLFDKNRLAAMKKGALLLNVGRGSAIDQDALIAGLKSGHLGGAGLDVTSPEPLPVDSPLWHIPNVIITPHISGGHSLELTVDLIIGKFVRYLADYVAGRPFEHVVNRESGY